MKKILVFAILPILICALIVPTFAYANTATKQFAGCFSSIVAVRGNCPLVLSAKITFNITDFPSVTEHNVNYTSNVQTEYEISNPTDGDVSATIVFPLGLVPDYLHAQTLDVSDGSVEVNGESVGATLRFTYYDGNDVNFNLEKDMGRLLDERMTDAYYNGDLPVHKHVYKVNSSLSSLDISYSFNQNNTRAVVDFFARQAYSSGKVTLTSAVVGGETFTVWFVGEDVDLPSTITVNGKPEPDLLQEESSETLNFNQFAFINYDEQYGISETDWYNAVILYIKAREFDAGVLDPGENLTSTLMRWYQYQITVPARSCITSKVTVPLYPDINQNYSPAKYDYAYLLSPATTWASFAELDVVVNTDCFVLDSSCDFTKTEDGYNAHFDGLPQGELTFQLCQSKNPKGSSNTLWLILLILPIVVVLSVLGGVIAAIVILCKKRNHRRYR